MAAPYEQTEINARERIIVALDVDSETLALSLIDELGSSVGAFKIGLQLFTTAGPSFVRTMTARGHRIFLDLKFHDIPNTAAMAGVEAARLGVWMFNVHALGGGEMMRRTVGEVTETCERENLSRPQIIAVTILTSSNANDLREIGIEQNVDKQVADLALLAANSGIEGVVASALEASQIKLIAAKSDFIVVTPGIRPASESNDDQKRVVTPANAIRGGSDFLVIGRPITKAVNKREVVEAMISEIEVASNG